MKLFPWWPGWHASRRKVMSWYKRGLACAEQHDSTGAPEAYTSAIERRGAPDDVRAMSLYNRALMFAAKKDIAKAVADLNAVMTIPTPLRDIKLATKRRLDRIQRRPGATAERVHQPPQT